MIFIGAAYQLSCPVFERNVLKFLGGLLPTCYRKLLLLVITIITIISILLLLLLIARHDASYRVRDSC